MNTKVVIAVGVAVVAVVLLWSRRIAVEEHHLAPGNLPPMARALIEKRMVRHGRQMEALGWQVTLLEYEAAASTARSIAEEPSLARPLTGDASELNAGVPPRFFDLQDQLRASARAVAAAADRHDAAALSDAWVACARTCFSCHQLYLDGK